MRIAFRVDASLDIGTGHVMRCLTLAEALRDHQARCHFICRDHEGNLLDLIRQHGFEASSLPRHSAKPSTEETEALLPSHIDWLGCDWRTDAGETRSILTELNPEWLVVDHYGVDLQWETVLSGSYRKLLVVDDLADRHHTCNMILDQNLGHTIEDYRDLTPKNCIHLTGPRYAMLRPEFAALREYGLQRRKTPSVNRMLIAMGGVDQPNATGKILEALQEYPLPEDCQITVVMGALAPWLDQVRAQATALPWRVDVRVNIPNMAEVMADSNLAIGAAGISAWERCCLGLPSLLIVLAENQWSGARALHQQGAALLVGDSASIQQNLPSALSRMLDNEALSEMSKAASAITDGMGVSRIVQNMGLNP